VSRKAAQEMSEVVAIRGRIQNVRAAADTPTRVSREQRILRERAAQADEG
jgi:hypothetical protein